MFQRRLSNLHKKTSLTAPEVSEARFRRFLKDLEGYEKQLTFEHTMDSFLDLYSSWKKTHNQVLKIRLVMLAFELHRLNTHFQCDLNFTEAPCEKSSSGTSHPPIG